MTTSLPLILYPLTEQALHIAQAPAHCYCFYYYYLMCYSDYTQHNRVDKCQLYPSSPSISCKVCASSLPLISQLLYWVHTIWEHANQELQRHYDVQLGQHLHTLSDKIYTMTTLSAGHMSSIRFSASTQICAQMVWCKNEAPWCKTF